jgi:hypothetical protein
MTGSWVVIHWQYHAMWEFKFLGKTLQFRGWG